MALTLDHSLDSISPSSQTLVIGSSGGVLLSKGSTAQRPSSPSQGTIRYNTDLGALEVFDSSSTWQPVSSSGSVSSGGDSGLIFALIFGS